MSTKKELPHGAASKNVSRRDFLKKTVGAASAAVAFPYIIPASALGADGTVAPSNRHVLGVIGCGGQGVSNMKNFLNRNSVQVVAVCDVDTEHRNEALGLVNQKYSSQDCKGYNDFRELLARGDLDMVSIAVPDHWHAIPAIAAAKAGLDIYAEKPLALTISQGRAMCDAVHRYKIVWQTGSWQRSKRNFRYACELVRNGRIGAVHTIKVDLPTGLTIEPQPEMPIPAGFDYDFWLGPAPYAPYTENRCHWNFRWILDYSGGQVTDWAAHHCDIAQWGMGTEHTGPVEVEGRGEYPREGLYNAAVNYYFECQYPAGVSPVSPDGFKMIVSNKSQSGVTWEGPDGWIQVDRGGISASNKDMLKSVIGPNEVHLYESNDHTDNFLECVKTRALTITPIEVAHRSITIGHLGNIAMQLGRKVRWNPEKEQFIDDPAADRMLTRAMRGNWHI